MGNKESTNERPEIGFFKIVLQWQNFSRAFHEILAPANYPSYPHPLSRQFWVWPITYYQNEEAVHFGVLAKTDRLIGFL